MYRIHEIPVISSPKKDLPRVVVDNEAQRAAGRITAGRRAVALGEDAGTGRPGGDQETHHAP